MYITVYFSKLCDDLLELLNSFKFELPQKVIIKENLYCKIIISSYARVVYNLEMFYLYMVLSLYLIMSIWRIRTEKILNV